MPNALSLDCKPKETPFSSKMLDSGGGGGGGGGGGLFYYRNNKVTNTPIINKHILYCMFSAEHLLTFIQRIKNLIYKTLL